MARRDNLDSEHKKSKRKKQSNVRYSKNVTPSPTLTTVKDEELEEEEEEEEEEEVLCDGEVEMDSNDDNVDNIDVETADADILEENTNSPMKAKQIAKNASKMTSTDLSSPSNSVANNSNSKKSRKRKESGTSSDEERWLTAIESGKLEEVDDELKKIKDPKLMTARQRAMYERTSDAAGELLMSLPIGYREREKPQTAEDIQKAVLKSQKRKQQADEKREKDKKKTMERLLKKQESKQRSSGRNKNTKTNIPMISYVNNADGAFIHLPVDHEFPLKAQTARQPPEVKLCGIVGCGQPKIYNCSKTNMPLCSFKCYRQNVQSIKDIMC